MAANVNGVIEKCLLDLSQEFEELHPPELIVEDEVPSPLEFFRKYVSHNIPVILKGCVHHWPAISKWNHDYLRSKLQGKKMTVAVTPNGYADAVFNNIFVLPEERRMTFDDFLDKIENPISSVYYIQKQNNNLLEEFSDLIKDVDSHIPWATEALGRKPDAANFWMGDKRAVTSLHKDHYENIYCVIKGKKEFILHPPTDVPWIPYESYTTGMFCNSDEGYDIKHLDGKVKWISVDPMHPDLEKYPLYKNSTAYHCVLEKGDALYLPSLWFHHVRQSHGCIAVNYWYDMDFDIKYCYFKCLEKLGKLRQNVEISNFQD